LDKKPLVSIVTPSFNQAQFIEDTIRSVLSQNYPLIEYIVIDGGSTDGSVELIRKYADRLAFWQSQKDLGQTDAINQGFNRANGEILAWINSDDTYMPNAIEDAVTYLMENPEVGMVYGDANFIDEKNTIIGKFPAAQTNLKKLHRGFVHIPQQASFFRKTLWKQVGPLDPSFYFAMDYDLWVRLAKVAPIIYLPRAWANFRLHSDAKTIAADDRCWPEMIRVHYRDGGTFFSPIVAKYYVRKMAAPFIKWKRKRLMRKSEE